MVLGLSYSAASTLTAALIWIVLAVVNAVHQLAPPSTPATPSTPTARRPSSRNCSHSQLTEVLISPLDGAGSLSDNGYIIPSKSNCSGSDTDIKVLEPEIPELWKTHVVMACTIAAAIEIVLVIIIVLYWRQIRWTLRKLTCPSDCCRRGQHEPMERQNQSPSSSSDSGQLQRPVRPLNSMARTPLPDPDSDPEEGPAVQIFVGPRRHIATALDMEGPSASYSPHTSHSHVYS